MGGTMESLGQLDTIKKSSLWGTTDDPRFLCALWFSSPLLLPSNLSQGFASAHLQQKLCASKGPTLVWLILSTRKHLESPRRQILDMSVKEFLA